MNKTTVQERFAVRPIEPIDLFDAMILYDDIVAGKRGLSLLTGMNDPLSDGLVELRPRPWRLDLLQDPYIAEQVAEDFKTAHVLILSTSGHSPLHPSFKRWFITRLAQKRNDQEKVAIVALLGMDPSTIRAGSKDLEYVKKLTLDADLDFVTPVLPQSEKFSLHLSQLV